MTHDLVVEFVTRLDEAEVHIVFTLSNFISFEGLESILGKLDNVGNE